MERKPPTCLGKMTDVFTVQCIFSVCVVGVGCVHAWVYVV